MRIKTSPAILLAVLTLSAWCHGQQWSGILDPANAIDWSNVGTGGIPSGSWTQSGSTITATGSDQTSQIQSALNSCGNNQFVLLAAGTFRLNGTVNIPANCVLRGSGADQTVISGFGTGTAPITLGSGGVSYSGALNINSGAAAGSTSIVLSGTSGVSVGGYLVISELNDPSYVTVAGGEGNCNWCDGWSTNGTRARGQIVEVTSISGNTVGIAPGLYSAYTHSPTGVPFTANEKYAGLESLQIYGNHTYSHDSIYMSECAYCWVKGVSINYADGNFIEVHWGYRDEIRDNYFSNAFLHTAGTVDSDVFIVYKTSASLVENNIIERAHASIMLNWGAAGNIVAYNYMMGEFDSGTTNFTIGGIAFHGAHPQFNLVEGNVMNLLYPDQVWGSSAYNTIFRNWTTGTGKECLPLNGRATVNCSGSAAVYAFQASRAMQIGHLSTHYNFVGNVTGSAAQNALLAYGTNKTSHVAILQYPSIRSYDSVNYNFTFGYGESSDDGSGSGCGGGTGPCHSADAYSTAFLHGNYTHADGNIAWASGVTQNLPPSFYLTNKPGWWGSLPWPAIGPDVSGGSGAGGHASLTASNPAMNCYLNIMGGSDGGPGSPLANFNAGNCYGSTQNVPPPTNLQATPH